MAKTSERMYAMLVENQGLDMDFIVGPDEIRIPAHQLVLGSASDKFRTRFLGSWRSVEGEDRPTIKLPTNTEEGVKAFIKGIYLDELDPNWSMDVLKELLYLSHEHMVEHLLKVCETTIIEKITVDNCLSFVETGYLEEVSKPVWDKCWECFTSNLPYLLGTTKTEHPNQWRNLENGFPVPPPNLFMGFATNQYYSTTVPSNISTGTTDSSASCNSASDNWSVATWKKVLQLEGTVMRNIKEETLFQQLLRWRNVDSSSSREALFASLIVFVRFPLMDLRFIADEVLPTKILTDKDGTDLLCQNFGLALKNSRTVRFNCRPRHVTVSPRVGKHEYLDPTGRTRKVIHAPRTLDNWRW